LDGAHEFGLEEEVEEAAFSELAAGEFAGLRADAHVHVGAASGADGAAGVLVEHKAFVRNGFTAGSGLGDIDEGHAGAGEDGFVGGEGAFLGDLDAERAGGPFFGAIDFEEGEAVVAHHVLVQLTGVGIEVSEDGGEGEVFLVDLALLHELGAEALVLAAVGAGVTEEDALAIGQDDLRGALDLDDEGLNGLLEVHEFEAAEFAGLGEFSAGGVGAVDFAGDGVGLEVGGTGVDGVLEFGGAGLGAVVDGGIVAGEPDGALVIVANGGVDVVAGEELLLELVGGDVLVEEVFGVEEGGEDLVVGDGVTGEAGGVEAGGGGCGEELDGLVDGLFEVVFVGPGGAHVGVVLGVELAEAPAIGGAVDVGVEGVDDGGLLGFAAGEGEEGEGQEGGWTKKGIGHERVPKRVCRGVTCGIIGTFIRARREKFKSGAGRGDGGRKV
jgi:hypothetical protein